MNEIKSISIVKEPFDPKKFLIAFSLLLAFTLISINVHISDEEILLNRGELNTDMASVDGLGNKHRYNTNKKVRN